MRHADVAYFDGDGRPVGTPDVSLTEAGVEQAHAAAAALVGISFDKVVTSGLARTLETARVVAPANEVEAWPDLREIESGRLEDIPPAELEEAFLGSFRGSVAEEWPFIGGETIGAFLDRVLPALERLLADDSWDVLLAILHGAVNRAVITYALTGTRAFFGGLEQSPGCINVLDVGSDWVVRAVNLTPYDLVDRDTRETTMERLYAQYRPAH